MTLGEKIQLLRKQKGWSQEQLASELSVSRQALSKWEMDTAVPDTVNIVKLSKLFSVSTDYLLDTAREQTQPPRQAAAPPPLRLTGRAKQLVDEKGYLAGYLLAARCVPGLLVAGWSCFAYLSALSAFAPLRSQRPLQAYLFPAFAGIVGLALLVKLVLYLLLARRLKKLRQEEME
jgi:transcriptional regulator with XRE-family HTH domain